eukprot:2026204-Rhodomonas_salina.1
MSGEMALPTSCDQEAAREAATDKESFVLEPGASTVPGYMYRYSACTRVPRVPPVPARVPVS